MKQSQITLAAYAKINLFLRVIRKRSDGYHDLEMIMAPLKLHDTITISTALEDKLYSSHPLLPTNHENLCIKALQLMRKSYPLISPLEIKIDKNIPIAAGLGGGSSNAATLIKGVSQLFNLNISEKKQMHLALTLGMDVPFFLYHQTMFTTGRGEKLSPYAVPAYFVILIKPNIDILSKDAFKWLDIQHLNKTSVIPKFNRDENWEITQVHNDFEQIIFEKFSEIAQVKIDLIQSGARCVQLTGTGSAVYALFTKKQMALQVFQHIRLIYPQAILTQILSHQKD
jgi:4-diphosphocytidyl-2-C-methyl-D-erythritol kinase